MSLYTDIKADVITWTNRPNLTAETDIAIRQAVRAAHKAGSWWRDLVSLPLTAKPTTKVQQLDLSVLAPDFRNISFVKPTDVIDQFYDEVSITDLMDQDGYGRQDIYYGVGNFLMIRAVAPVANITLMYYKNWTLTPITALDSWIATLHPDLISLWAAAAILAAIGEQEVKSRVDALAKLELEALRQDSVGIGRR